MRYLVCLSAALMVVSGVSGLLADPPLTPVRQVSADAPVLTLPETVEAPVGQPVVIDPQTNGKVVRYVVQTPGLIVFPSGQLADPTNAVVWSLRAGRYDLLAYTAVGDVPSDPAVVTVVVGDAPEPEPVPPPGPTPPPTPDLTGVAKAAYDAAPKGRPDEAQAVAGIYRGVASAGAAVSTMTPAEMAAKLGADMRSALDVTQRATWASFGEAMTPYLQRSTTREKCVETLNEIADGLEAIR